MNETSNADARLQAEHNRNIDPRVDFSAEAKREFLLASIRTARARLQAIGVDVDELGVSLKGVPSSGGPEPKPTTVRKS